LKSSIWKIIWIKGFLRRNGQAIFLFHAMGFNATSWAPNISELSRQYRIFAVDTIGDQGRSIVRRDYPKSGEEYAHWVMDLLDATGHESAILMGCSMGGWIAHNAAVYYPDKTDALILISPAAGIPERTTWWSFLRVMMFSRNEERLREVIDHRLGPYASQDWREYMYWAIQDPESARLGIPDTMSDEQIALTRMPTLLLIGDGEVVYKDTQEVIDRAENLIPDLRCEIIPRAGHMGHYDNPDFINRRVLDFLESISQ
jgi:pimeloyl-ACP methyl ester carboxylesterase